MACQAAPQFHFLDGGVVRTIRRRIREEMRAKAFSGMARSRQKVGFWLPGGRRNWGARPVRRECPSGGVDFGGKGLATVRRKGLKTA